MEALWADLFSPAFWVAAGKIIGINIILSGDNAVVIALACRMLPPKERFWGMVLGAGVAVVLRILFTLVVAQAMEYPFLKLVGGILLLWVAVKLVVPEDEHGEGKVTAADNLWRAVRIVAVADIVMSLDNVIAIAAAAESAAAVVDLAHASTIKTVLIVFGLVTSVPLIVAGSALLMHQGQSSASFQSLRSVSYSVLRWTMSSSSSQVCTNRTLAQKMQRKLSLMASVWAARLSPQLA